MSGQVMSLRVPGELLDRLEKALQETLPRAGVTDRSEAVRRALDEYLARQGA